MQLRNLRCPKELYDLTSRMLDLNPALRPSISEILKYPFFNDVSSKQCFFFRFLITFSALGGNEGS